MALPASLVQSLDGGLACCVRLAPGRFALWFSESGSWRDSGFGPFESAGAAVRFHSSL
jgi:hypothetical protein